MADNENMQEGLEEQDVQEETVEGSQDDAVVTEETDVTSEEIAEIVDEVE